MLWSYDDMSYYGMIVECFLIYTDTCKTELFTSEMPVVKASSCLDRLTEDEPLQYGSILVIDTEV